MGFQDVVFGLSPDVRGIGGRRRYKFLYIPGKGERSVGQKIKKDFNRDVLSVSW